VLSQALRLYRRHFGALVLTCALALLPANVLATGAVVFGIASLGGSGIPELRTHTGQVQEKQQDLREKPAPPAEQEMRLRQLGREAFEGGSAVNGLPLWRTLAPIAYATVILAALLLAGLFLAHAALVPLVFDLLEGRGSGPARAWGMVAGRIGPLLATGALGAVIVAFGSLFFIVPGLVLAAGFSLAPAITVLETASGHAALERSWRLLRGHWAAVLRMWALIVVFSALAFGAGALLPPGPWRPVASAVAMIILYPLPLTGLVLVYRDAAQYMRRISAPG
jgi:hypothetical protein